MKIAFVHDWLVGTGGGEKVLEALCELYDAPIYTLLIDKKAVEGGPFAKKVIHTSFLQKLPHVHKYYRNLLPFFPAAIESFDLSSYDLIISSSHAVAKGVKTHSSQIHICYCHTPMRYAWDLYDFHLAHLNPLKKLIAKPILKYLRRWDHKTHTRVNHFIANATVVGKRIEKNYGRGSTLIYPPVNTHLFQLSDKREDYYFTCSRFVPYKRIDLIVETFSKLPDKKLVIIGEGPEMRKIRSKATKNIEILGHQSDSILQKILSQAKAFIFAAEEDFGIVVVEAQAAGIPIIAYGAGGSLDTVLPGQTGVFFKEQTAHSLIEALEQFEKMQDDFEPEKIRKHAEKFSKKRFQEEIKTFVDSILLKSDSTIS